MGSSIQSIQDNYVKYADMFETQDNSEVSIDTFYQLLIAEMQNQDPLEPMSNTEFISQMASFTSLQSQKDALYYNQSNYASNLVGKTVVVASQTGTDDIKTETGVVQSVNLSGGNFEIMVNGKPYSLSNIMEIVTEGSSAQQTTGASDYGTYGSDLIGKDVTVSALSASGTAVLDSGTVTAIEVKDGVPSVIINGLSYSFDDIVRIENADVTAADNTDNTADTPRSDSVQQAQSGGGAAENSSEEESAKTTTDTTTSTSADGTVTTTTVRTFDEEGNLIDSETTTDINYTEEEDVADLTDEEVLSLFE